MFCTRSSSSNNSSWASKAAAVDRSAAEEHDSVEKDARAVAPDELTKVGADADHEHQHADPEGVAGLELDRERHRGQHRDRHQHHRQRLFAELRLDHRERAEHADQAAEQHRQEGDAVVLGCKFGQLCGRELHTGGCLDPQHVGQLHEDVDGPDHSHQLQGGEQAVEARVGSDEDVSPFP
jgi:hypothetical protein